MKLMTHMVGGFPTLSESQCIAETLLSAGSSYLEIQIPFSDPVADGPVIMKANEKALDSGTTPEDCFALMKHLRKKTTIPLLFMTYFNIPFRYGLKAFCEEAKKSGAYGLIIPDMPIDEEPEEHYLKYCREAQLHAIQVISPITPLRRLKEISKVASGFVYCVSRTGTTGKNSVESSDLKKYLSNVRRIMKIPLAVGFGITHRRQIEEIANFADIAVLGTSLMKYYGNKKKLHSYIESLII